MSVQAVAKLEELSIPDRKWRMSETKIVWLAETPVLVTATTMGKLRLIPGQTISREILSRIGNSHFSEACVEISEAMAQ